MKTTWHLRDNESFAEAIERFPKMSGFVAKTGAERTWTMQLYRYTSHAPKWATTTELKPETYPHLAWFGIDYGPA